MDSIKNSTFSPAFNSIQVAWVAGVGRAHVARAQHLHAHQEAAGPRGLLEVLVRSHVNLRSTGEHHGE